MKTSLTIFLMTLMLAGSAWANPMRFGRTDSPARFRVDLPGSWARGKVEGCFEDTSGSRLQAIMAENPERTVANTFPDWKKRFKQQGYEVREITLGGEPTVMAKGTDNSLGIVLHKGYQVTLMLNVSNTEIRMDELLEQLGSTFQWLSP